MAKREIETNLVGRTVRFVVEKFPFLAESRMGGIDADPEERAEVVAAYMASEDGETFFRLSVRRDDGTIAEVPPIWVAVVDEESRPLCPDPQDFESEEAYREALAEFEGVDREPEIERLRRVPLTERNRIPVRIHGGPPDTPNREDVAALVARVGYVEVLQAIADVARKSADDTEDEMVRTTGRGETPNENDRTRRDQTRNVQFFLEDAVGRLRRGFA